MSNNYSAKKPKTTLPPISRLFSCDNSAVF